MYVYVLLHLIETIRNFGHKSHHLAVTHKYLGTGYGVPFPCTNCNGPGNIRVPKCFCIIAKRVTLCPDDFMSRLPFFRIVFCPPINPSTTMVWYPYKFTCDGMHFSRVKFPKIRFPPILLVLCDHVVQFPCH